MHWTSIPKIYASVFTRDGARLAHLTVMMFAFVGYLFLFAGLPSIAQTTPPITITGELAYGASSWQADVRFNDFAFNQGERITAHFDATLTMTNPELYNFGASLYLMRVADADGAPIAPLSASWTSHRTPGGLPLMGVAPPAILIATTRAINPRPIMIDNAEAVRLRLLFNADLPSDLPEGWYQWRFVGHASIGDSTPFDWYDNRIFSTIGQAEIGASAIDIPALVRIGTPANPRLLVSILDGVLPDEIAILPPAEYALAPEILAPDLPVIGDINASLTMPDGTTLRLDDLNTPITFDQYGNYTLTLIGTLADDLGTNYVLDGIYHLIIAEHLALEPAILPATPFIQGDVITPNLRLTPSLGMPYDVRVILTLIPLDGNPPRVHDIVGTTNAYGFFSAPPIITHHIGEYTITYEAHATHEDKLYATIRHSTGVIVASDSPSANGQRGIVGQNAGIAQAWYDTATYPDDAPDLAPHPHAPFFSGDVLYLPDNNAFALQPTLTQGGAIPAYSHIAIAQPAVIWRNAITSTPLSPLSPNEINGEIGSGLAGLRPADYGFILGGVVSADGVQGYASAMVITSDASARILPPFTRPLLTVDSRPREMLFYASSLMAGSALTIGEPLTLTGYLAPSVGASANITLTSPSGHIIQQAGQTNRFGYLYAELPPADSAGIWQIALDLTFEGSTSAGELVAPIRESLTWEFYVIPAEALMLTSTLPTIRPVSPAQPLTLNFTPPADWQDVHARYTLRTPSYTLISTDAPRAGGALSVTFNRAEWARRFPNIEGDGRGTGATASDAVHITLYAQGTDADGNVRYAIRTVTLWHDMLYTFEDDE